MRLYSIAAFAAVSLSIAVPNAFAQNVVAPQNRYERLICVVPIVGKGTPDDPKRPLYAPLHSKLNAASRTAIMAYTHVTSDDGKFALVQFAARDRAAFKDILADKSVKAFLNGRDKREDVESELKKYKADFDFKHLELRVQ